MLDILSSGSAWTMLRRPAYVNAKYLPTLAHSWPGGAGATYEQVAFSPNGQLIAGADATNNKVDVFNLMTGLVTTLATGSSPFGLTWSHKSDYIFTVSSSTNTVSRIAYPSGAITSYATGGTASNVGIVVTMNDQEVLVNNESSANLSRINLTTSAVTLIPMPAGPAQLSMTPDGKLVVCSNFTAGSISRIRLSDNAVLSQAIGSNPSYLSCSLNNSTAWVTLQGSNKIVEVDIATLGILHTVDFNTALPGYFTQGIASSPDGSAVYLLNCDPTFTFCVLLTVKTSTLAFNSQPGTFAAFVSLSPDGHSLAAGNFSTSALDIFNCLGAVA